MMQNYLKALIDTFMNEIKLKEQTPLNQQAIATLSQQESIQKALGEIMDEIKNNAKRILPPLKLQTRIPNAPAKEPFVQAIEVVNFDLMPSDEVVIATVEGLEAIEDVVWNIKSQKIEGTPQNAGDFTLTLKGLIHFEAGYSQSFESFLRWSIIPDPKSLWRDIEPDFTQPYPKANEESHYIQTQNAKMLYVSKRGRSHAHVGSFRDDDGVLMHDEVSQWHIVAIADGAGSCKYSRQGSKIAVESSAAFLLDVLKGESGSVLEEAFIANQTTPSKELSTTINEHLQKSVISAVHKAIVDIHNEAKASGNATKEYSTTLLLCAYKPTPKGHLVISFWVGDGVAALYNQGKDIMLLGSPDGGEFAGQTQFLDSSIFNDTTRLAQRIKIKLVDNLDALILATDGVSDPFFTSDEALGEIEKWESFWQNEIADKLESQELGLATSKLLSWLDFWSVGNHDDRTMALLLPIKIEKDEGLISSNETMEEKEIEDTQEETTQPNQEEIKALEYIKNQNDLKS
ncbi:MAG: protein phosphatase 2C domain-containing protein [Campylobacterales bacterium]|nr:protein phosphatase 2C domain-containing protein [Campylobacterales bacterium]